MAAPTFQAAGTAQAAGAAAITVPWPAHAVDDIAFLVVESGTDVGLATANGFVRIPDIPQTTTSPITVLDVYWCRATSTSMASPVTNASINHIYGVIVTARGCLATGDPWDVTSGGISNLNNAALSATGDTTTVADCLVFFFAARGTDDAAAQYSGEACAGLTSLTEQHDAGTAIGNGGGLGIWTGVIATAGAYGPLTATLAANATDAFASIALKPAAGGATGTVAVTEENDTSAISGTVANPVTGTIGATEGADTSAIAAVETIPGTIAATEGDDTSGFSGSVANPVTGTIAYGEEDDSGVLSGTVTAAGVTGTIAVTEDNDSSAFSGNSTVPGTMVTTEENDSGVFAGTVANPVTGSIAPMEQDDTSAFTGLISNLGTVTAVEGDDTSNLVAVVANPASGTMTVTEQDDTSAFTGSVTGTAGLQLPVTGTIGDDDNSGTIRDRSRVAVLSSANRTGTISP